MNRVSSVPPVPTLSGGARLLTAALLTWLLIRGGDAGGTASGLRIGSATPAAELAAIRANEPARPLSWSDTVPPSLGVLPLLAGAARSGTPVVLHHPDDPPHLRIEPPSAPVAMRRAALDVTLRGVPGDEVTVVLGDETAVTDSVVVRVGETGTTRASVAVLPTRPGPATWTARAGGGVATAHAWVRQEAPVRALVLTGPPDWESRFALRALEAAGMSVAVRQALGRGQAVVTGEGGVPGTMAELSDHDVVIVLDRDPDRELLDLLWRWAAEAGGGVLLSPAPPSGSAAEGRAWRGWGTVGSAVTVDGETLSWAGPAEIEPLPPAPVRPRVRPLLTPGSAVAVVSGVDAAGEAAPVLLAVAAPGRGRVAASGLETWRWRMEGGQAAAHEAFWSSLVEWLAGGLREPWTLAAEPVAPGAAWTGRLEGAAPDSLAVAGPARGEVLPVARTGLAGSGSAVVRLVPRAAEGHALGGDASHGAVVLPPGEPVSWARAALAVGGAGGVVRARTAPEDPFAPSPRGRPSPWIPFLTLALLAATGWATRRLGGLR